MINSDFYCDDCIEPAALVTETEKLLDGFNYTVHSMTDPCFDYLCDENHRCIALKNKIGEELFIDFEDEFTLSFGEWHSHYFAEKQEYEIMSGDIKAILSNSAYAMNIHCNDEWMGSMLIKGDILSRANIKNKVVNFLKAPEFLKRMNENGIEVFLKFWDSDLDKQIIFVPGEIENR